QEGLKGRPQVAMPRGWAGLSARLRGSPDAGMRTVILSLGVTFGDPVAVGEMRRGPAPPGGGGGGPPARPAARAGARGHGLAPLLHGLLAEAPVRGAALKALAGYDDPHTPAAILAIYPSLNSAENRDAVATLAARAAYGKALLEAVAEKKIPATDVSADLVRQL